MDDSSSSEDEFYDAQETTVSVASQLRYAKRLALFSNFFGLIKHINVVACSSAWKMTQASVKIMNCRTWKYVERIMQQLSSPFICMTKAALAWCHYSRFRKAT